MTAVFWLVCHSRHDPPGVILQRQNRPQHSEIAISLALWAKQAAAQPPEPTTRSTRKLSLCALFTWPFWHPQLDGPHGQPSSRWWHPSSRNWRAADDQCGGRGKEEANAGSTCRLSSLFTAVFGNHLQPVLNHAFQCSLRVGSAIECLFPAGSWRSWCRRPVCKKSVCVSRVLAYAGMN